MGFWHWWGTIDWGNAPGWVGTVLTSASLFLAISILRRDQKKGDRLKADAFVTWLDVVQLQDNTTSKPVITWRITFNAYNAGDSPIAMASVFGKRYKNMVWIERLSPGSPENDALMPKVGGSFVRTFQHDPKHERYFVVFRDATNRLYRRDLRSGEYLSHRQIEQAYWRERTGSRINYLIARLRDKKPEGFDDTQLLEIP